MIVYRLCKAAHVALDGEGARLWGGRWNSAGRPMVYAAASPSLAVLEVLVHLDLPSELLPNDFQLLTINVPDDGSVIRIEDPILDNDICRQTGDAFLVEAKALALIVPSVVVPQERNVLLNPRQAEMGRVIVERAEYFRIDQRLIV